MIMLTLLASLLSAVAKTQPLIVDFLDVGQGDAIVLRVAGKAVLIDSGDRGKLVDTQLKMLGVEEIDLAIASHPHADHIGSMVSVLKSVPVKNYLDNGLPHTTQTYRGLLTYLEQHPEINYIPATAGLEFSLGSSATLTVLFPASPMLRGTRSDLNSNSVVVLLNHNNVQMLFTGDAEAPTERRLIAAGLPNIELLKVGHHGSKHSSIPTFLSAISPEVAVISAGKGNRYGHPHTDTLTRLAEVGAQVYRTDLSGHIRVISDGTTIEIFEGSLTELGPFWPLEKL
jgi:competence protein ComEC